MLDKAINNFVSDYHVLVINIIYIGALILAFVAISGCIRFGIAIWRRKKGTYPPAASQMEDH